jgi:hypothetical protein
MLALQFTYKLQSQQVNTSIVIIIITILLLLFVMVIIITTTNIFPLWHNAHQMPYVYIKSLYFYTYRPQFKVYEMRLVGSM